MNNKTPIVEFSEFVEHIIQKFTLPKYPDLKRHHLADWEVKEMRDTIEYICQAQRNACIGAVECMVSKQVVDKIRNAEITKEDYE